MSRYGSVVTSTSACLLPVKLKGKGADRFLRRCCTQRRELGAVLAGRRGSQPSQQHHLVTTAVTIQP